MNREFYYINPKAERFPLLNEESKNKLNDVFCWICQRTKGNPVTIPDLKIEGKFSNLNYGILSNKIGIAYFSDSFLDYFKNYDLDESLIFGKIYDSNGNLINGYKTVLPKYKVQLYGENCSSKICRNCGIPFIDWIRGKFQVNLKEIPNYLPLVAIYGYHIFLIEDSIAKRMKEDKLRHISIYKVYNKSNNIDSPTEIKDFLSFEDLNQYPYFENAKIPN